MTPDPPVPNWRKHVYFHFSSHVWIRASTASALYSRIGDTNWGSWVLWILVTISTVEIPHRSNARARTAGCRLSVFTGWSCQDNWSAVTLSWPSMCLALNTMLWLFNHKIGILSDEQGKGTCPLPTCLLIWDTTVVLSIVIKTWWPYNNWAQSCRAIWTTFNFRHLMWRWLREIECLEQESAVISWHSAWNPPKFERLQGEGLVV